MNNTVALGWDMDQEIPITTPSTEAPCPNRLITPNELERRIPLSPLGRSTVKKGRRSTRNILEGQDDRLLVVAGPCSMHDKKSAMEYAQRLKELSKRVNDAIMIIMRAYFEKPRTTMKDWKGLMYDPELSGVENIEKGLLACREISVGINNTGLPTGTEVLEPTLRHHLERDMSYGAIGTRTALSQTHRGIASSLSYPTGIKNDLTGSSESAVNGVSSARGRHMISDVDRDGRQIFIKTTGNPHSHVILRGGDSGPNYDAASVQKCEEEMTKEGFDPSIVIDLSHGNSRKIAANQGRVLEEVMRQRRDGNTSIKGVMVEGHLYHGKQKLPCDLSTLDPSTLQYGVSVTDECIGFEELETMMHDVRGDILRMRAKI